MRSPRAQPLLADPAALAASPGDRALLADIYAREVGALPAPSRDAWIALHGDAHLGNVFITDAGPVWSDFEAVCRGPLEWDLANKPAAFLAALRQARPDAAGAPVAPAPRLCRHLVLGRRRAQPGDACGGGAAHGMAAASALPFCLTKSGR